MARLGAKASHRINKKKMTKYFGLFLVVVVTESPTSDERKRKIFEFIDSLLQKTGKIGEYDQKI